MREIKFNFVYGIDGKKETYFTESFTLDEIEGGDHWAELSDSPLRRNYSIIAKRQYTGLLDKSGDEIYEGDIVTLFGVSPILTPAAIEFTNNAWELSTTSSRIDAWAMEVIGNIYENPEMLEKSE